MNKKKKKKQKHQTDQHFIPSKLIFFYKGVKKSDFTQMIICRLEKCLFPAKKTKFPFKFQAFPPNISISPESHCHITPFVIPAMHVVQTLKESYKILSCVRFKETFW